MALKAVAMIFQSGPAFRAAQKMGRLVDCRCRAKDGQGDGLDRMAAGNAGRMDPGAAICSVMPKQTFREWCEQRGRR